MDTFIRWVVGIGGVILLYPALNMLYISQMTKNQYVENIGIVGGTFICFAAFISILVALTSKKSKEN